MIALRTHNSNRDKDLQVAFLVMLPAIHRYGVIAFRHLRSDDHDDAVQETIANAFVAYARLVERGRADLAFPTVLARFAVAQVRDGRRVGTQQNTRGVLSWQAQRKGKFVVHRLDRRDGHQCQWIDALIDARQTSVPDQAAFRVDFPAWLNQLSSRNQQVARLLVIGNSTSDVACHVGITPGRVSQVRRELYADWQRFHGESVA